MATRTTNDKKRDRSVNFAASDDEIERLQWAADELGLTLASYCRMASLEKTKTLIG